MKKLFILLALCGGISLGAFAQANTLTNCQNAMNTITPGTGTTPGLSPSDSSLPCATIGQPVNDTIYFTNYDTVTYSGLQLTLNNLTIDSLYLPNGLCWSTNSPNNTFTTGQNGVIYVTGTPTDSAGQYKLRIIVTAVLGGFTLSDINAETYTGLAYRVRVINSGCGCPTIDNSHADSAEVYIKYDTCQSTGIRNISNNFTGVSVTPNPISTSAKLTFSSSVSGTYTLDVMNLLGEVVSSKSVNVGLGNNEFTIDRTGLSSGIYLLSVNDGTSAITRKIIVE